jgi:hypothetical protein
MKTKKEGLKDQGKQPMKYWLVQFTFTSGEIVEFYVSAISEFEAYKKADGYVYFVNEPKLLNKLRKFRLLP